MLSLANPSTSMGKKKVSVKAKSAILGETCRNIKKNDITRKLEVSHSTLETVIKKGSKIDADIVSTDRKRILCATYDDVEALLCKWPSDVQSQDPTICPSC